MIKNIEVTIEGVAPLILCNVRLANPSDPLVKAVKEFTDKRANQRTEEEDDLIKKLKWVGALYTSREGSIEIAGDDLKLRDFGDVIIPSMNLEACIIQGAKKTRKGPKFQCGMFVSDDAILEYPNKVPVSELYHRDEHWGFAMACPGGNGKKKIPVWRPLFNEWSCTFRLSYLTEELDASDIRKALEDAGTQCGLGTWRPKHGRFNLVRFVD